MTRPIPTITGPRMRRLTRLAAVAGASAIGASALLVWLREQVATPGFWRLALAFVMALEWAYLIAAAAIIVGVPLLIALALGHRGLGASRSTVARGLLALASMAIALATAEGIGAAWLGRVKRSSVVPVGGRPRGAQVDPQTIWPPISAADVVLPESFPDRRDDGAIELVVVGESSAQGVPYNAWVSIGRLVAWKLEEAIPSRRVRLQVVANSGDTLELQHQRLATIPRRPDMLLVYCGHNEFGSRLNGARRVAHYLDADRPPPWRRLLDAAEATSPLCELIRRTSERCRLELPATGPRDLIDVPAFTPDEARLLLADFRRRLEAIVAWSTRLGALTVLLIPPGNDAGFEPNRSYLPAATPEPERAAFRRDVLAARRLESADPSAAIAAYRRLIDRQPGFAELHFRLGVLLDHVGDADGAYRAFVAARDADGYPIRCPTPFQDVYRDLAARYPVVLVDGQAELHAVGPRGLLEDHLFQDAMHPSLRGQIALAQAVLRALRSRRALGWPADAPSPTIDPSRCAARFGIGADAWKALCLWGVHFGTYVQDLRYDSAPRLQRKAAHAAAHDRLEAGASVESLGLPNLGVPEPVPALLPDAVPTRMPRSRPP